MVVSAIRSAKPRIAIPTIRFWTTRFVFCGLTPSQTGNVGLVLSIEFDDSAVVGERSKE